MINKILETHVSQVFHNVEEIVGLLARVAHRVDGFPDNQILGDFGPHVLLSLFHGPFVEIDIDVKIFIGASSASTTVVPDRSLASAQETREQALTLCA